MKVAIYADFRSPHAQGWVRGVEDADIEVVRVSSERVDDGADLNGGKSSQPGGLLAAGRRSLVARSGRPGVMGPGLVGRLRRDQSVHSAYALLRLRRETHRLERIVADERPELVHALRLPYEGLNLLSANISVPRVVSTWGQDFVPQAQSDMWLRWWISRVIGGAAGLHVDNAVDIDRARGFGLSPQVPTLLAAGNFGVDEEHFYPGEQRSGFVLCGRRPSFNIDINAFVAAVHELRSTTHLTFGMIGVAEAFAADAGLGDLVRAGRLTCYPELSRSEFAAVVRSASVVVSPSTSDGMPNTVLEALSAGCKVVAGRLPQLVELSKSVHGLSLVDLGSPGEVAHGVRLALSTRTPTKSRLPNAYRRRHNVGSVREFYSNAVATYRRDRR